MDTSLGLPPAQEEPSSSREPLQLSQRVPLEVRREPTRMYRTHARFRHTFVLNLEESRLITIVQAHAGAEARILYTERLFGIATYNKRLLGVATPERLVSGCAFTLSDGTPITVQQLEGKDIQVWHKGWQLREVLSRSVHWAKWIMVGGSGMALIFVLILVLPLFTLAWIKPLNSLALWIVSARLDTVSLFSLIIGGAPVVGLVCVIHALLQRSWGWVVALAPLTLLDSLSSLPLLIPTFPLGPEPGSALFFYLPFLFVSWLAPLMSLIYGLLLD